MYNMNDHMSQTCAIAVNPLKCTHYNKIKYSLNLMKHYWTSRVLY